MMELGFLLDMMEQVDYLRYQHSHFECLSLAPLVEFHCVMVLKVIFMKFFCL